jgi:hypothetical protein
MIDRFFEGLVQTWFGSDRNASRQQNSVRDPLSLDIAAGTYRLLEGLDIAAGTYRLLEGIDSGISALTNGVSRLRHGQRHSPVGCG